MKVKLSQISVYSFKWKWKCHLFHYILFSERESITFHLKLFIVFLSNCAPQSTSSYSLKVDILKVDISKLTVSKWTFSKWLATFSHSPWLPRLGDSSKLRNVSSTGFCIFSEVRRCKNSCLKYSPASIGLEIREGMSWSDNYAHRSLHNDCCTSDPKQTTVLLPKNYYRENINGWFPVS